MNGDKEESKIRLKAKKKSVVRIKITVIVDHEYGKKINLDLFIYLLNCLKQNSENLFLLTETSIFLSMKIQ